jgi:hypothetical protein
MIKGTSSLIKANLQKKLGNNLESSTISPPSRRLRSERKTNGLRSAPIDLYFLIVIGHMGSLHGQSKKVNLDRPGITHDKGMGDGCANSILLHWCYDV